MEFAGSECLCQRFRGFVHQPGEKERIAFGGGDAGFAGKEVSGEEKIRFSSAISSNPPP
jgi:hypothetical protein